MASRNNNNNVIRGGYWLAQQATILPPERIPVRYFTHLFYGFAAIDPKTYRLIITQNDMELIQRFMETIRTGRPQPKAFLSIGGPRSSDGNDPSIVIAEMASNISRRAAFIASTIENLPIGFDGVDLAWEFPQTLEEMANIGLLFSEWRDEINRRGSNLCLAATVYFSPQIRRGIQRFEYPADALEKNLDFLNVIAYDYSPSTPAHAQVFIDQENQNTSLGITRWLDAAVSANKLLLGIPLYGQKWTLADENDNGIGARVVAYNGPVAYRLIPRGIEPTYDENTISEYLSDGISWYGFDGRTSINAKIQYARTIEPNSLGGYFLYPLGDDDDQHTLSQAAYDA